MKLQPGDPWLLQAIITAAGKGPGLLKDIVAAGDALNHAMFTFEELQGGLGRLLAAGLIAESANGFVPTAKSLELYSQISQKRSLFDQRKALGKAIGADAWTEGYDPGWRDPTYQYEKLSPKQLAKAEKQYHKEFWAAYRRIKAKSTKRLSSS